jgi:transposase
MTQYKRIGIDTSKAVFTLHGIDQQDRPVLRIDLRRAQMISFSKNLPPTVVALEACGASHYWAHELTALGHTVRLIPPQYVKPYVKRGKNDRNDAEAICEAAGRPGMHFGTCQRLCYTGVRSLGLAHRLSADGLGHVRRLFGTSRWPGRPKSSAGRVGSPCGVT